MKMWWQSRRTQRGGMERQLPLLPVGPQGGATRSG